MHFEIKTERLTLRPFTEGDAPALNRVSNEPGVLKWMPDWENDVAGTGKAIRWFISQYPLATKDTARVMLAVTQNGELIGMVGIGNKEEVDGEIEMAWFVSAAHAGRGYITEAARAAAKWAFQNLGMDYLIAIVEPENIPSRRVAEKCGFKKVDSRMILNSGEAEARLFDYYRLYGPGGGT